MRDSGPGYRESPKDRQSHLFLASPAVHTDLTAVAVHTLAMFAVMAAVAVVVYERLGLMILKRTWFNVDLLWAGALVGAGTLTLAT